MTVQITDKLKIDGQWYPIYPGSPLSLYLSKTLRPAERIRLLPSTGTNNVRSFVAFWEIDGATLYLVGLDPPTVFDRLFPGRVGKIEAVWFTGEIFVPQGEPRLSDYIKPPWIEEYERFLLYEFKEGKVVRTEEVKPVTAARGNETRA